jgi:hypothetical protein
MFLFQWQKPSFPLIHIKQQQQPQVYFCFSHSRYLFLPNASQVLYRIVNRLMGKQVDEFIRFNEIQYFLVDYLFK